VLLLFLFFVFLNHILAKENKKYLLLNIIHLRAVSKLEFSLGPLFFSIYINDLPLSISSTEVDCDMFADDLSLSASGNNIAAINAKLPAKHPRSNRIVFRECNVAQPREN